MLCTVLNQRCRKSNGGHSDTDGMLVSKSDRVSVAVIKKWMDGGDWLYKMVKFIMVVSYHIF